MTHDTFDLILSEKKGPCLSIIIPMNRLSRDRMLNPEIQRKAIRKAKSILKRKEYSEAVTSVMLEKLNDLTGQIKPVYDMYGLGLFISPEIAELIEFPFPVKEKIIMDTSFETRDILYLKQFLTPYYVLVLGKNRIHLYSAVIDHFIEIKDGNFPMEYHDDHEYEHASIGTSFGFARKGFEKDKSALIKMRTQSFFKEAGTQLASYMHKTHLPLIVAGIKNQILDFKAQPSFHETISGEVIGSFNENNFADLRSKAWLSLAKYKRSEVNSKIKEFTERDRLGHLAKGIQEVWLAAHEGKGLSLLVEKDFNRTSYLRNNDPILYTRAPKGKYTIVPDAVDEIIETVIEKGGKVTFAEEGKLNKFDSIALLLRY